MKHIDIQVKNSFEISGSLNIPIVENTGSIPTGINSGSIFFNKEDNNMYIASASQYHLVGTQTQPPPSADIEYLVIAGGGGGGENIGGGGGAGGYLSSSLSSIESGSSITVTVGAGGSATGRTQSYTTGAPGSNSSIASSTGTSFSTVTSTGGGYGAVGGSPDEDGGDGGSGGGAAAYGASSNFTGGSGTTGQGNNGGNASVNSNVFAAAGGGGAGGAGGSVNSNTENGGGGQGGSGLASYITGTSVTRAGGGNGYYNTSTTGGSTAHGTNGAANSGNGGGGYWSNYSRGAGGSGVVILAYDSGSINAAGGIVGDQGNGRKYHQFNSSGTFKAGSTSDFGIVTDGLVVHLDAGNFASRGTSTWTDLSGNGRNFTANNGPILGNNFYYDLDGSNDYFGDVSYQVNDYMTMMAWIKPDSLVSADGVIDINTSGNDGGFALGSRSNNNIGLTWRDDIWSSGGYPYLADDTNLIDDDWHCIAGVYDGNAYLYVDDMSTAAQSNTSRNSTLTQVSGQYIRIGLLGNQSSTYALDGGIGMVLIYSKALTTTELLQNYNATKTNFV